MAGTMNQSPGDRHRPAYSQGAFSLEVGLLTNTGNSIWTTLMASVVVMW